MTWKKGQSGNPAGRKSAIHESTAKGQAIKHANKAFKALVDVLKDPKAPHAARVSAASSLLDRAYGKAPQDLTVRGSIEQQIINLVKGLDTLDRDKVQENQGDSPPTTH